MQLSILVNSLLSGLVVHLVIIGSLSVQLRVFRHLLLDLIIIGAYWSQYWTTWATLAAVFALVYNSAWVSFSILGLVFRSLPSSSYIARSSLCRRLYSILTRSFIAVIIAALVLLGSACNITNLR